MRTLIVNGTVVNASGVERADVLVDGERIAVVGVDVARERVDRTIDAAGKLVIPGAVDIHTHMELPVGDVVASDTFETGTRAAAFGGTTTIVDFATQSMGRPLREGLEAWHVKADGHACIDYGFHMAICDVTDATLAEMDELVREGVTSFKLFTAYPGRMYSDDGEILRAMFQAADSGGLILMHAENGIAIDVLAARYVRAGLTSPWYHGLSRPATLEAEAVNRVARMADVAGIPVYIVHLSSRDALEEVRRARERGTTVYAETCPQYLFLSDADLARPDGAAFVCAPPLRPRDHQAALWDGLISGELQLVSTDHAPFDLHGPKTLGHDDFRLIPGGVPGVEERVDLIHDAGVVGGRISLQRWVELISAAPARLAGLEGRKGVITPGADADIVIYDPNRRHTLSASTHHMNVDYSCYEGRVVQGGADVVLSRGEVIVDHGQWLGRAGHGRFLKRSTVATRP